MVLEIKDGLIIVCGPVAESNKILARRIYEGCPRMNKRLIPFPEVLVDAANGGNRIGDIGMPAQLEYLHGIYLAYNTGCFAVCEGCYPDEARMSEFLRRLQMMRIGYDITLIKLLPRGEAVRVQEKQRRRGFSEIMRKEFRSQNERVKCECWILDLDGVELKFL